VSTTDTDPVISGADDITIEKNSTFVPRAGVTAWDAEDGDLTDSIQYSGNVNPNAVGVYTATYTVVDSDGNVTTVQRTVTVVFIDRSAPLLSGIGAATVLVGQAFDPLAGVTAVDTVDGNVDVTVEGSVNVWVPGQYNLVYSAEDESGNKVELPRVVTVTFGDFIFLDATTIGLGDFSAGVDSLSSPALNGGIINPALANFTYMKAHVTLTASGTGNIGIALGSAPANLTELAVSTSEAVYDVYFVLSEVLVGGHLVLNLNGLTLSALSVDYSFAEARDTVLPVLSVPAEFAYMVGGTVEGLEAVLRKYLTASDNIDGNIKSLVQIDLGSLDLNAVGVYDVTFSVTDSSDNTVTVTRPVTIGNLVDSGFLTDPTFQNNGDGQWHEKSNDGDVDITFSAAESTMAILVNNDGNWVSAAGSYFSGSSLNLEAGAWYCFSFTAKTTLARTMWVRMGLQTDQAHGWLDDFDGNSAGNALSLTTEYQTFTFYFKLNSLTSSNGDQVFKIELNLGDPNYGNKGNGQTTTFQNVIMYKVVTEFEAPTFTENFGPEVQMPTVFTVGSAEPDWATYVTAKDMSNNLLVPVITESVNMNVPGVYDILFEATDIRSQKTTYTLQITVVAAENADTVGPVISKAPSVPEILIFDQFTNYVINYTALVTIEDAVDGPITPTLAMVDNGGLNLNVAGVYNVTYTCYDKSGNVGTVTYTVTVRDKQVPTITIGDKTVNVGESFDPRNGLNVTDNVDGAMNPANVTITGVDAFTDENGIVDLAGEFQVTYEIADAAGNLASKTITVTVANIVWDQTKAKALTTPSEAPYHCTVTWDEAEQAYAITGISQDEWYQPARLVYYFNAGTDIVIGRTYMFEVTAKAVQPTTLGFRVGSTLTASPWIDNFKGGNQTISITDEYVTYRVVFTADKTIPSNVKFQFQFGYNGFDTTNTIYVKSLKLVPEKQPIIDQVADLAPSDAFSGSAGNGVVKGTDNVEHAATLTNIPAYTYDWATGKLTYYFNTSVLTYGQTYRFALTAKATTETIVKFWIGTGLGADPWIDTFDGVKGVPLTITTGYTTQYVYFTVDKESFNASSPAKFEFTIGYGNDTANTLYVTDFVLQHYIAAGESVDLTSFDEIPVVNGGTELAPVYADAAAVIAALPTSVTAYDGQITVPVASWADTDTFNPTVPGYYTFTATLGALPEGVTNLGGIVPTVEVIIHIPTPQVVVNNFESYADNADYQANTTDNIVGTRVASGDFVKSKGTLFDLNGDKVLMSDMMNGTNGIKIKVTKAELPATVKYIGIWMKVSSTVGLTSVRSFIYSASAYNEVTSSLIVDFSDLAKGTYVYLPVSALKSDTIIISFVVYAEGTPDGDLYLDDIMYCEEMIPNAAPVASISNDNLAIISGMTFKAGESLEATFPTLLSMFSVTDAEDGIITPTAQMVNLGGLNLANPARGTYNITFTAVDSDGAVSNTLTVPIWIVTIIQDWNSYADDAAFKAAPSSESRLFGFRTYTTTTNPSMLPESGSLVVDTANANNYLQVVYGYNTTNWKGMNGMQVYVSKAELVAAVLNMSVFACGWRNRRLRQRSPILRLYDRLHELPAENRLWQYQLRRQRHVCLDQSQRLARRRHDVVFPSQRQKRFRRNHVF
jgi:hypothetical protein